MINVSDAAALIGTRPPASLPPSVDEVAPQWVPPLLEHGSVTAQTVAAVWSGTPVTVVKSPPGGGKTRLLVHLAAWLVGKAGLTVEVVTFTNDQADAIFARLTAALPEGRVGRLRSQRLGPSTPPGQGHGATVNVMVAAYARQVASRAGHRPAADVVLVDEAYQLTFKDVVDAVGDCPQIVLVGDPGQIGPVVTVDTGAWESMVIPPHLRAPEAFERMRGVDRLVLSLSDTHRFGPATTRILAPLYDFPFGTKARPNTITAPDGRTLPEVDRVQVPVAATPDDPALMGALAGLAAGHIGATLTVDGQTRMVVGSDIAVVVSRSSQMAAVSAMLRGHGHGQVTVGTADKLQGGQWAVVVALDPLTGGEEPGAHQTSTGRLCVMLSRHTARVVWVDDGQSIRVLAEAKADRRGVAVREAVLAATGGPATADATG